MLNTPFHVVVVISVVQKSDSIVYKVDLISNYVCFECVTGAMYVKAVAVLQDDKDLVHEFVCSDGLDCLIKVGTEADQNHQNYILRGSNLTV